MAHPHDPVAHQVSEMFCSGSPGVHCVYAWPTGDLKPANVLLKSTVTDSRGFNVKCEPSLMPAGLSMVVQSLSAGSAQRTALLPLAHCAVRETYMTLIFC